MNNTSNELMKSLLERVASSQHQVDNSMDAVRSATERIEEMRELLRRSYRYILWLNGHPQNQVDAAMDAVRSAAERIEEIIELRPYMKKQIEEIKKLKSDLEEELGEEPQKKGVLKNGS